MTRVAASLRRPVGFGFSQTAFGSYYLLGDSRRCSRMNETAFAAGLGVVASAGPILDIAEGELGGHARAVEAVADQGLDDVGDYRNLGEPKRLSVGLIPGLAVEGAGVVRQAWIATNSTQKCGSAR